ncbi:MAG: S41 family peptidase [Prolixibacteraceae bacterium]|nr:S41 family peptidase [Prolixibacteraceae bacterium]
MKKYNIYIPVLLAVAMIAGLFLGNMLGRKSQPVYNGSRMTVGNKLNITLDLIDKKYVDKVESKKIIEKTIPQMLENLDPHSSYIPAKYMQEVEEEMRGNFSGIGVRFSIQEDSVVVIAVISGGPSENVGVMQGDRIVMVDDTLIAGVGVKDERVLKLLRGIKGTRVRTKNYRRGFPELLEFEITRGDIPLTSIDVSYMIDEETGFVKIGRFSEQTYSEFKDSMDTLIGKGAEKVIIDLRSNQGGSLTAVVRMVDEFLEAGEPILITRGKSQPEKIYNASDRNAYANINVIILIDEFSASASEIMAGAIQDNDRGIIVGRRSFGKGLVQEQTSFSDGSAIRLTVARYYTPSGRCIQKPYTEGNDKYSEDLYMRLLHGEMLNADSIHFADSLKYYTKNGRLVYGGGGIMPDIFVPADTTGRSDYYVKIHQQRLNYQFAFQYSDQNRETLKKLGTAQAIEKWLDNQNIMDIFIRYAESKGVPYSEEGMRLSGEIIKTQVKANIAQNILGEEGFYPIIQQIDKTLLKAIDISRQNLLEDNL